MKRVEFIKGSFPPAMEEGNLRKTEGEAAIRLMASTVMVEGPIKRTRPHLSLQHAGTTMTLWLAYSPAEILNCGRYSILQRKCQGKHYSL